jgi:hypothetical protein
MIASYKKLWKLLDVSDIVEFVPDKTDELASTNKKI